MSGGDRLINPTAEAALLGAMMIDNRLILEVADRIAPEDFADALNGRIYQTMLRFAASGKQASAITLQPIFMNDGDSRYGAYLHDLVEAPAVVTAAPSLADQVSDLSARRKVRDTLRAAIDSIHDDLDVPVDEITGRVEAAGWAAVDKRSADVVYDAGDLVGLVLERDRSIREDPRAVGLTNALIDEFDMGIGPIERGTYNIIAGRPGMGKTALAGSLALGFAIAGHATDYFNLEMKAAQVGLRSTADISHAMGLPIEHEKLKKGALDADVIRNLLRVQERARLLPLRYHAPGRIDIMRLWSMIKRRKALWAALGRELECVVVDYMGKTSAKNERGQTISNGFERMAIVSPTLKAIADEENVALIALAQLSRKVEERPNKRPILSDLRESGELEQDADSVTLLYREEYYLEQSKPKPGELAKDRTNLYDAWEQDFNSCRGKLDMIFAKNRHGRSSTKTCKFLPAFSAVRSGSFNEFDDGQEPLLF